MERILELLKDRTECETAVRTAQCRFPVSDRLVAWLICVPGPTRQAVERGGCQILSHEWFLLSSRGAADSSSALTQHMLKLAPPSPQEDLCRNHYLIDGKYYDALRFKRELRAGILKMFKAYCAII